MISLELLQSQSHWNCDVSSVFAKNVDESCLRIEILLLTVTIQARIQIVVSVSTNSGMSLGVIFGFEGAPRVNLPCSTLTLAVALDTRKVSS